MENKNRKRWMLNIIDHSVQFSLVQSLSCVRLCDLMNCSTPGFPVHHQLPEFTQTHVHRVGDAIQPSHPLSSPSPPAPNPSQHLSLFQWVNSLHEVAKVLEFQPQHQSFQWTPRTDLLQNGLVGSPCSPWTLKSLLQHHSSKASILLHSAFFVVQLSHLYMTTGKTIALTRRTFVGKVMSLLGNCKLNWKLKIKIKITTHALEWTKSKTLTISNISRMWSNRHFLSLLVGMQNGTANFGRWFDSFL